MDNCDTPDFHPPPPPASQKTAFNLHTAPRVGRVQFRAAQPVSPQFAIRDSLSRTRNAHDSVMSSTYWGTCELFTRCSCKLTFVSFAMLARFCAAASSSSSALGFRLTRVTAKEEEEEEERVQCVGMACVGRVVSTAPCGWRRRPTFGGLVTVPQNCAAFSPCALRGGLGGHSRSKRRPPAASATSTLPNFGLFRPLPCTPGQSQPGEASVRT